MSCCGSFSYGYPYYGDCRGFNSNNYNNGYTCGFNRFGGYGCGPYGFGGNKYGGDTSFNGYNGGYGKYSWY